MKKIFLILLVIIFFANKNDSSAQGTPLVSGCYFELNAFFAGLMEQNNQTMSTHLLDSGLFSLDPLDRQWFGIRFPYQRKYVDVDGQEPPFILSILRKYKATTLIQIELRKDDMVNPTEQVTRFAFVCSNGDIRDRYGSRRIRFEMISAGHWFVVINQANHQPIGSSQTFEITEQAVITYDFRISLSQYFNLNDPKLGEPAIKVGNSWAARGDDCSGSGGNLEANGGDGEADLAEPSMVKNMKNKSKIFHRADLNLTTRIDADDEAFSWENLWYGTNVPFIKPEGDFILPERNYTWPNYALMAGRFFISGDTVTFSINLLRTGDQGLEFTAGQFFLDIDSNALTSIQGVFLERILPSNHTIQLVGGTIRTGMITGGTIISNTYPGTELARIGIIFHPGFPVDLPGLLKWHSGQLMTKVFALVDTNVVDITDPLHHYIELTTGVIFGQQLVDNYQLSQNYPNPFNPTTEISFSIPKPGMVRLTIFDVLGREVIELLNRQLPVGTHEINFNGSNLTTGTYFYRLEAGEYVETKKMLLMK